MAMGREKMGFWEVGSKEDSKGRKEWRLTKAGLSLGGGRAENNN
jgi:hypothetical protein